MRSFHEPVMGAEVLHFLITNPEGTYVDATVGGGGHTRLILSRLRPSARVVGIDRDPEAVEAAGALLTHEPRLRIYRRSFSQLSAVMAEAHVPEVDGILADLGVSSHQIDAAERGFGYMQDGPLDMRMNPDTSVPVAMLLHELDEKELARIIKDYGEERRAWPIARAIIRRQRENPITTTAELRGIIEKQTPVNMRIKTVARVFQALRIRANEELEELREFLPQAFSLLAPRGRLVILSYHSLEDRIVKKFMAEKAKRCSCPPELPQCVCGGQPEARVLTHRVVKASSDEIRQNPRARSAKLRALEKKARDES